MRGDATAHGHKLKHRHRRYSSEGTRTFTSVSAV